MSLCPHLLATLLMIVPVAGCEVEDEKGIPATPAPAEPTRPVPQPQVMPTGRPERILARTGTRPAAGPAFAPSLA